MIAILFFLAAGGPASTPLVADAPIVARGELKAGAPLKQQFKLSNRSNQTVEILGVTFSCGCSRSGFDMQKLNPGDTATLTVEINTLAHADGPWSWTATVRSKFANDTLEHSTPLKMTGTLSREITLTPPGLAFSLTGGAAQQRITIADSRGKPLVITSQSASAKYLALTMEANGRPNRVGLSVVVQEDAPIGEHREWIALTTTDPDYPELRIPVTVVKRKPTNVKASPEVAEFRLKENERSMLVQLRRADGKPLTVDSCESNSKDVGVKWSKDAGIAATLRVSLSNTLLAAGQADITVKLADPPGESLTIPVRWTAD